MEVMQLSSTILDLLLKKTQKQHRVRPCEKDLKSLPKTTRDIFLSAELERLKKDELGVPHNLYIPTRALFFNSFVFFCTCECMSS